MVRIGEEKKERKNKRMHVRKKKKLQDENIMACPIA